MSAMRFVYMKNRKLETKFREMFHGVIYQLPALDNAWAYEPKDCKRELYFPEGTTEREIEALVAKSVREGKDYVYDAVKDAEPPRAAKEYLEMIARGVVF